MATISVNASTLPSIPTAAARGMLDDPAAMKTLSPTLANAIPAIAPTIDSTRLSAMNCRISRPRPAPSAARNASSLCRPSARISSRLARFAQAMSSTNPTAA